MGMAAPLYYTADMVRALPEDGNRYEVVYGELSLVLSLYPVAEDLRHVHYEAYLGEPL